MIYTRVQAALCIINSLFAIWFVKAFHNEKLKIKACLVPFIVLLTVQGGFLLCFKNLSIYSNLLSLAVLLAFSFTFKNRNVISKITAPVVFETTQIIISKTTDIFFGFIKRTEASEVIDQSAFLGRLYIALYTVILFSFLCVLIMFVKKNRLMKLSDYILIIVFPLVLLLQLAILDKFSRDFQVPNSYINFSISFFLIFFSYIGVFYLISKIVKNNKLKSEKEMYQRMLELENKRYYDMKRTSDEIRKIRHNLKNSLYSLKAMVDDKDLSGVEQRLNEILGEIDNTNAIISSGNRTVDYIVNAKLAVCTDKNISVFGDISGMGAVKDIDLSIILGNILDNAIQATDGVKNAKIELNFFVKGKYQNMICKNTISESVLDNNPGLNTIKYDSENHGLGIPSVMNILAQYDGEMDFFEQNGMFCVHIIFPV